MLYTHKINATATDRIHTICDLAEVWPAMGSQSDTI